MSVKGRYPFIMFVSLALCLALLIVLLANRLGLVEALAYTATAALFLYILFCRGASRFLLQGSVLRVAPLLSHPVTIDLLEYELVDYTLNFFSLDRKSNFFLPGWLIYWSLHERTIVKS